MKLPLLLLLLVSPLWADSVTGKITVTKKPGRVEFSGKVSMKTGKVSKLTRTVKNDTEVKVLKPRDVVVVYNPATQILTVELIERTLSAEEKKYTAVGAIEGQGHAGISTIQKLACLTVPVRERHGRLEVSGDAEFGVYGDTWAMPVPRSTLDLSGSLKQGVRVRTSGHNSDTTSDIRWDFQAEGRFVDPTERAPKSFLALRVSNREVEVQTDWETDGTPYLTIAVSEEGKTAALTGGQQVQGPAEIHRLIAAVEGRKGFSKRDFHLTNRSGTYTLDQDGRKVVLSRQDSAKLVDKLREAARYLGIR